MPWLYDNPETLDYSQIDEPIRDLVMDVNASAWLRTEESCAGHPSRNATGLDRVHSLQSAWPWCEHLYLRLVVLDDANIKRLLKLVEKIGKGFGKMHGFGVDLMFDRIDELGTHWYCHTHYDKDVNNRDLAISLFHRYLKEESE